MNKLKSIIKNNKIIYFIYNYTFSFILKLIGLFCKIDNKLILFNSFGGAKYDDSPKVIYEYMKKNKEYEKYKLIWVLDNPDIINDLSIRTVKNNSIKFFITALKAKYWITNSSMERGLKFKKKKTIYINTWHGTPLKKMGIDTITTTSKFRVSKPDIFYCQSVYDANVFSKSFQYDKKTMKIKGLPRNDELCDTKLEEIRNIKEKLKIPFDKKVILYAPTFREYNCDINGCFIAPPIDIHKWKDKLSNEYIVLFRAHYEVNKILNIKDDKFIYNMTDYSNLNELLKISDILISDYSSIMIDYSILERPIYSYCYDYEEYLQKRGLYFDLREKLPNGICTNEDDLLKQIQECDFEKQKIKTRKLKEEFVQVYGNARKYIDEIIKKEETT